MPLDLRGLLQGTVADSPELLKLQIALEQLIAAYEGDLEVTQVATGVNIGASTLSAQFAVIIPPADQSNQEWIPQLIIAEDTANIDVADRLQLSYFDVYMNQGSIFFNAKPSQKDTAPALNVNTWIWPSNFPPAQPTAQDICMEWRPLRCFRRSNLDQWRRINVDFHSTATVGTRQVNVRTVYIRRPTTRI